MPETWQYHRLDVNFCKNQHTFFRLLSLHKKPLPARRKNYLRDNSKYV